MKPEIFATIMDFFSSGLPVVNAGMEASGSTEVYGKLSLVPAAVQGRFLTLGSTHFSVPRKQRRPDLRLQK